MTGVTLNAIDAAELAEMLQLLADWLKRDPDRLRASLEDFVGHPAYNTSQLQEDLDRFLHADIVSFPLHLRHVSIRAYACQAGRPVTGLADPSGGQFDSAGDFDRLMITTKMLIRQHHRCPHPKGSELLPEPHRAVVAEVAARLPSNAVALGTLIAVRQF